MDGDLQHEYLECGLRYRLLARASPGPWPWPSTCGDKRSHCKERALSPSGFPLGGLFAKLPHPSNGDGMTPAPLPLSSPRCGRGPLPQTAHLIYNKYDMYVYMYMYIRMYMYMYMYVYVYVYGYVCIPHTPHDTTPHPITARHTTTHHTTAHHTTPHHTTPHASPFTRTHNYTSEDANNYVR